MHFSVQRANIFSIVDKVCIFPVIHRNHSSRMGCFSKRGIQIYSIKLARLNPLSLLHVAMQFRPYHHPNGMPCASGRLTLLHFWMVVAPSLSGLAQDCLLEMFPEFTRFCTNQLLD